MYTAEEVEKIVEDYATELVAEGKKVIIYKDLITEISAALDVDVKRILIDSHSRLMYDDVGLIDGKKVGRITNLTQSKKILHKMIINIERNRGENTDADERVQFLDLLYEQLEYKVATQGI